MKTGVIQNEPNQLTEEKSLVGIAGITTRQEEYERRVVAFFDDALLEHR